MLVDHPVPCSAMAPSDSSFFVSGTPAASMLGRERRIKLVSRQFYPLGLWSGLLQEPMLDRIPEKTKTGLSHLLSLLLPHFTVWRKKQNKTQKNSSRLISLHPEPQIKDLENPRT